MLLRRDARSLPFDDFLKKYESVGVVCGGVKLRWLSAMFGCGKLGWFTIVVLCVMEFLYFKNGEVV